MAEKFKPAFDKFLKMRINSRQEIPHVNAAYSKSKQERLQDLFGFSIPEKANIPIKDPSEITGSFLKYKTSNRANQKHVTYAQYAKEAEKQSRLESLGDSSLNKNYANKGIFKEVVFEQEPTSYNMRHNVGEISVPQSSATASSRAVFDTSKPRRLKGLGRVADGTYTKDDIFKNTTLRQTPEPKRMLEKAGPADIPYTNAKSSTKALLEAGEEIPTYTGGRILAKERHRKRPRTGTSSVASARMTTGKVAKEATEKTVKEAAEKSMHWSKAAAGVGTLLAGAMLIKSMNDNKGRQTPSQLYGQQSQY